MTIEPLEPGRRLAGLSGHNFVGLRVGRSGRLDPGGHGHVFLHSREG